MRTKLLEATERPVVSLGAVGLAPTFAGVQMWSTKGHLGRGGEGGEGNGEERVRPYINALV